MKKLLLALLALVILAGCKPPDSMTVNRPSAHGNVTPSPPGDIPAAPIDIATAVVSVPSPFITPSPSPVGTNDTATPPPTLFPPPITDPAQAHFRTFPKSDPPPAGIGGWTQPRLLTDAEKAKVIEIAINSTNVKNWLNGKTDYKMGGIYWFVITWNNGTMQEYECPEYDVVTTGVPGWVSPNGWWYPAVTLSLGEWGSMTQMQMAIDVDNGKVAYVDGPYPPPGQFPGMRPPGTTQ